MSRAKARDCKLPELFCEQSWHDFLSQQHSVNQELLYRDPEKAGWTLLAVLKGEGEDAPELFRVYQCGTRKIALPSEFVTEKVAGASGATNTDLYQEDSPKGMQGRRRQQWTSAIALIHFFGDYPKTMPDHPKLRALLISKALFQIISHDINRLLDSSNAPGNQALFAKEAGAAYESGLKNFLTSLGALNPNSEVGGEKAGQIERHMRGSAGTDSNFGEVGILDAKIRSMSGMCFLSPPQASESKSTGFRASRPNTLRTAKLFSPQKVSAFLSWKHSGFHVDGGDVRCVFQKTAVKALN